MDERIVEDPELEAALEKRETMRGDLADARADYQQQHQKAIALLAKLNLDDGDVVRVGRFRVTKQLVPAHEVTFEAEESERIRIRTSEA